MAVPAYRAFLSHSGKDKEFVKELYRRLTRDGVACFFDIESIGWGDNWVRVLEHATDECDYIVPILCGTSIRAGLRQCELLSFIPSFEAQPI